MKILEDERHSAKFTLPLNTNPLICSIQEMFLPNWFIKCIAHNSNLFGKSKGPLFVTITKGGTLFLFSIVLYVGVVKLPSKEDCWNNTRLWPKHIPCKRLFIHGSRMFGQTYTSPYQRKVMPTTTATTMKTGKTTTMTKKTTTTINQPK